MFERYTEKARRVIFFARYEATQFGAPAIEPEHLLLGLMREDKTLISRLSPSPLFQNAEAVLKSVRREIESRTILREKLSTSVELPLAPTAKRVLAYAHEESDRLQNRHIGTEHLLLGLLREERSMAAEILYERGLRLVAVRESVKQLNRDATPSTARRAEGKEWFPYVLAPLKKDDPDWEFGRKIVAYDPIPVLEKVKCPILILLGDLDWNYLNEATEESVAEKALKRGGNKDFTVEVFHQGNHAIWLGKTGGVKEFPFLKSYAPGYFQKQIKWLLKRVNMPSSK